MNKLKTITLCIVFMLLLSLVFNNYVAVYYDYWFRSHESSFFAYVPAVVAVFLPLWFNYYLNNPSDFLCWVYYVLVVLPTAVLTPQLGLPLDAVYTAGLIVIVANIFILLAGKVNVVYAERGMRLLSWRWFSIIFMALGLGAVVLIMGSYKLNIDELMSLKIFVDTYEIRSDFRDAKADGLVVYAVFWAAKIIFPGIIAYGLCYRKRWYVWVGVALQLVLFSVSVHKSFLFSIILIFFVYFLIGKNISFKAWMACATSFVGFSLFAFHVLSLNLFVDVFVRRAFAVPGILSGWWVQFFSENPYAWFAGGALGGLFGGKDQVPAAFRIGDFYLDNSWTSANVNFAIDAFGNGGMVFVLLACAIVFVSLTIINSAARLGKRERIFFICISVPLFWTLVETSLITAMITHGLFILLALALAWRAPRPERLA